MTEGGQRAILVIEIRKTESWKKKMEEIEVTSHHQREGAYKGKPHFTNGRSTSRSGVMTSLGKHANHIKCGAQQGSRVATWLKHTRLGSEVKDSQEDATGKCVSSLCHSPPALAVLDSTWGDLHRL
ncbi:hypothetical protein BHM03_00015695 [Ensete ventricosum]|nr:hypothetical protein BHM03_00015695 [Ensete ventricosum]